jgi:pimeloyl-ACP methyl ester carboxylesterase
MKETLYTEEEITFSNNEVTLAGTLTLPEKSGKHPAVIMITGSGPLNRDEECFGMKPFRMIADHFTRNGIAVLRYDSRGVGGSTGNTYQSTTADFAFDVIAAIRCLKARDDISHAQIGLCGHSEGGIIAPLVASQSNDVAFVICISGIGGTGGEITLAQSDWISRADGVPEAAIEELLRLDRLLLELVRKGASETELKAGLLKKARLSITTMRGESGPDHSDIETAVESHAKCMLGLHTSPWFRYFIDYDPKPALVKVKCPVLLLFGGLDFQVPEKLNRPAMIEALERGGNQDYTVKIFPEANHLYVRANTGSPSEYDNLAKEFVPGFLDGMSDWILERVEVVK